MVKGKKKMEKVKGKWETKMEKGRKNGGGEEK